MFWSFLILARWETKNYIKIMIWSDPIWWWICFYSFISVGLNQDRASGECDCFYSILRFAFSFHSILNDIKSKRSSCKLYLIFYHLISHDRNPCVGIRESPDIKPQQLIRLLSGSDTRRHLASVSVCTLSGITDWLWPATVMRRPQWHMSWWVSWWPGVGCLWRWSSSDQSWEHETTTCHYDRVCKC